MENKLVSYFSNITPLSLEEKQLLEKSSVSKTFLKGSFLLIEGQVSAESFFILEGCVREYILDNGEEKTTNFFTEGQWIISLNNFTPNSPKIKNWICVEDTTMVIGNEEMAQEMFKQFPRFETISRVVMETVFSEQMNHLTSYLTDTPEQRYLKLLKSRSDIFQRVPQYQIASYIGVKAESLSRIRKRILQGNH
jgi:CRP-like cAMP-binding protein